MQPFLEDEENIVGIYIFSAIAHFIIWSIISYFNKYINYEILTIALILGVIAIIKSSMFRNNVKEDLLSLLLCAIGTYYMLNFEYSIMSSFKEENIAFAIFGFIFLLIMPICYIALALLIPYIIYVVSYKYNNAIRTIALNRTISGENIFSTEKIVKSFNVENTYMYDDNINFVVKLGKQVWIDNETKRNLLNETIQTINNNLGFKDIIVPVIDRIGKYNSLEMSREVIGLGRAAAYCKFCEDKYREFIHYVNSRTAYINQNYLSVKTGLDGEDIVNKELSMYDNIYKLPNIRLEVPDNEGNLQSIENDNILISKYGIFVLEVKNFGINSNYDIVIERDGRWLKYYRNTRRYETLKNVSSQNNRHIAFLNKYINNALNRNIDNYIEADSLIVIANEKVGITNNTLNQHVVRTSEIYPYVKNSNKVTLTLAEMNEIRDILLKGNLGAKKYPIYNYKDEIMYNLNKYRKFYFKSSEKFQEMREKLSELNK